MAQVQNWFINSRKRHLLPQLDQEVPAEEPRSLGPQLQSIALQRLPKIEPQMALEMAQTQPRVARVFWHPGAADAPKKSEAVVHADAPKNTSVLFNSNKPESQGRLQAKAGLLDSLAVPRPKTEPPEAFSTGLNPLQLPRLQELMLPHLAGKPFVCLDSKSLEVLKKLSTTGRQSYDTGDPAEAVQLQPDPAATGLTVLRDHGLSGLQRYLDTLGLLGSDKAGS